MAAEPIPGFIGTVEDAKRVLELIKIKEEFTPAVCEEAKIRSLHSDFNPQRCDALASALSDFMIDEEELYDLGWDMKFSKAFLETLRGKDGTRPLRERAKWLTENIKTPKKYYNPLVIAALEKVGKAASSACPALLEAIDKGDGYVQLKAAISAGAVCAAEESTVQFLIARTDKGPGDLNNVIASALARIGGEDVANYYIDILRSSDDPTKRFYAATFLGRLANEDNYREIVSLLERSLHVNDHKERLVAAQSLASLGKRASSAAAALAQVVSEKTMRPAKGKVYTAVPAPDDMVLKLTALDALAAMGEKASDVVPVILGAAENCTDKPVIRRIITTLAAIDPEFVALAAMHKIGEKGPDKTADERNSYLRWSAVIAAKSKNPDLGKILVEINEELSEEMPEDTAPSR